MSVYLCNMLSVTCIVGTKTFYDSLDKQSCTVRRLSNQNMNFLEKVFHRESVYIYSYIKLSLTLS